MTSLDFWTWHFIEEGWDFGFVEALVDGEWVTVPLVDDSGTVVTTNDDPHGNNTEGNGITGTSGGEYFVDEPQYVHYTAQLPAGATDVRFRYSTDAAYLDTGWFVDDVMVNGAPATLLVVHVWRLVRDDRRAGEQLDGAGRGQLRPHARRHVTVRDRGRRRELRLPARGRPDHAGASTPSAPTARTATSPC